jgi:E3 ubiquitin-protein ligase TRIP12
MASPVAQLILTYPSLFSFRHQFLLFRLLAFDPETAARLIHREFGSPEVRLENRLPYIRSIVDSDLLFEQGCLLQRLGDGHLRLSFPFVEEMRVGEGPSQEFFQLMAQEFCRRDDIQQPGVMVFCTHGLFPAVTANPALLGSLSMKAMLTGMVLGIPFNPSFFKMVKGQVLSVGEVNPQLTESLECHEGLYGLPFVYLGTDVELKRGGWTLTVDESNVAEYVALVTDFTCGAWMRSKVDFLVRAFETNIQRGALTLLTSEEIVRVISGQEIDVTVEPLRKHVILEHGYQPGPRQITDFFQLFANDLTHDEKALLLKFVTGCSRLPFGGVGALVPPLTIARKEGDDGIAPDMYLPTVMTCSHYLKLPAYSNKQIMKKKLLLAIRECRDSFQLS